MASSQSVQCFGKKKTATAVAHCKTGKGLIKVNGKPLNLVQPEVLRFKVYEPLLILGLDKFAGVDIRVRVSGGGHVSQVYAIRQAIAKSIVAYYQKFVDEHSKNQLKQALVQYDRTLLVADNRRCEPKKFGGPEPSKETNQESHSPKSPDSNQSLAEAAPPISSESHSRSLPFRTMSSSSAHHRQDYIARVRYENKLPPPPGAPKLLEIPSEGLEHYLSAGYASRMVREQPLNIEADAFMGMPIDLIGMPGIFDGDEKSIQAPDVPPPVDPRDAALLRPIASLGKPSAKSTPVSFLRRTEYISAESTRSRVGQRNWAKASANARATARPENKQDPMIILRDVIKGFDIAYPDEAFRGEDSGENIRGSKPTPDEIQAWKKPVHPTNPNLKVLDIYPVLPDSEALPPNGGYIIHKFSKAPTDGEKHDSRLDAGILHPKELPDEVRAALHAAQAAHEANPDTVPAPQPPAQDYDFFVAEDEQTAKNFLRKANTRDPDYDNPELYTYTDPETVEKSFRFAHLRHYETGLQKASREDRYREVAIALHDIAEDGDSLQKAAYYYPIIQRIQLRPRRSKSMAFMGVAFHRPEEEEDKIDYLHLRVGDPEPTDADATAGDENDDEKASDKGNEEA
ncbi:MAG: hypothetical protein M1834_006709 [Cirrosporium novae-zelandiae]|nr:MAG: hypothetical protein M1834_006709 [Cirrosporium novae-zelandiae]